MASTGTVASSSDGNYGHDGKYGSGSDIAPCSSDKSSDNEYVQKEHGKNHLRGGNYGGSEGKFGEYQKKPEHEGNYGSKGDKKEYPTKDQYDGKGSEGSDDCEDESTEGSHDDYKQNDYSKGTADPAYTPKPAEGAYDQTTTDPALRPNHD
ncbi:unnamed protein product [Phytophthora fragariaefolia]|uniref:Unnamed protein product n=1 Tax=Phytophthora fragariaefolia TaxID=1490495 RepID=A0A9W7DEE5_9STRA|nr:unnamed protein product [Phytophthora fragariaefolia]